MARTAAQTSGNGTVATLTRDVPYAEGETMEIAFPRKYLSVSDVSDDDLLILDQFRATRFIGNMRSYVERQGKTYTSDEILALYDKYKVGAPREIGSGKSIRERAANATALALLVAQKGASATFKKGDQGKTADRILQAIDDGSASDATRDVFNAELAKLRAEAEAKRGTKSTKTSVEGDAVAI